MYSNFTVLIPQHNRPERLKRLLDYLLSYKCNVLVVDSSDNQFKYLDQYNEIITYRHYPKTHLAEKLVRAKELVHTPYIVMCAEDDFVIPETVKKVTDFLDENNDYASGQGIFAQCRVAHDGNIAFRNMYPWIIGNSLTESLPERRARHLERNYYQFYYAVYRTSVFFETFDAIMDENGQTKIKNLCVLEKYMAMYGACKGKHVILPLLYNVREYIIGSAGSTIPNLFYLREHNKCQDEILCWKSIITPFFVNKRKPNKEFDSILNEYFYKVLGFWPRVQRKFQRIIGRFQKQKTIDTEKELLMACIDYSIAEKDLKEVQKYHHDYLQMTIDE